MSQRSPLNTGLTVLMQSVLITTKVVSLNPAHGEAYSKQLYVIKFVSDLLQISGFIWVLRSPPPIILTVLLYLEQYTMYLVLPEFKMLEYLAGALFL